MDRMAAQRAPLRKHHPKIKIPMPGKFSTWLMTLLVLILLGLTIWIVWAVQKVEGVKKPGHSSLQRPAQEGG